jgi:hypothetical protein
MSEFAHTVLRAGSHVVRLARRVTPLLVPGSGWSGATAQPDAVGDSEDFGYDAKAIARWDVVPFQTFTGTMNVGVVAFHREGIDRVDFAVNGGDWRPATSMRLNPTTGVVEYFVALRASDFADGPVEVRAIAYPNVGEPRVLAGALTGTDAANRGEHSMFLNANAGGTLVSRIRYVSTTGNDANDGITPETPKATIKAAAWSIRDAGGGDVSHGLIYLAAGNHAFSGRVDTDVLNAASGWLTIAPAPGVAREDARITTGGSGQRLNATLTRLHNVTLTTGLVTSGSHAISPHIWLDNVNVVGPNRFTEVVFSGYGRRYITDTSISTVRKGMDSVTLARNVDISHTGEDGCFNPQMLVNVTIDDVNPAGWEEFQHILSGEPHPDVVQWSGGGVLANVIYYGLKSSNIGPAQGIFMKDAVSMAGFAVVNAAVQSDLSQIHVPLNHFLLWHCTFTNSFRFRDGALLSGSTATNISVRNTSMLSMIGAETPAGNVVIDNNHGVSGSFGANGTTGDALLTGFTPGAGSPLRSRLNALLVTHDVNNNPRSIGGSIGAVEVA